MPRRLIMITVGTKIVSATPIAPSTENACRDELTPSPSQFMTTAGAC
jgi:hypothetical protein